VLLGQKVLLCDLAVAHERLKQSWLLARSVADRAIRLAWCTDGFAVPRLSRLMTHSLAPLDNPLIGPSDMSCGLVDSRGVGTSPALS
jgi:hypothetical protein